MTRVITRRRMLGTVVATMALTAMAADHPAGALETTKVEIGTARDPNLGAVIIIASEKGFFKEAGLDVNVNFFPSGGDLAAAVVGGSVVMGSSGSTPTTTLRGSPFPIKILARQADISGAQQIVVKSNIDKPQDLHGKRVGYMPGTASELLFGSFAETYGLDRSKITLISMGPTEMVTSFARGDVVAISLWEAHATRARQAGDGKVLHSGTTSYVAGEEAPKRIYGDHSALFATEDFIAKNPQTVRATLRALAQGIEFIESDFDEASGILARVLKMDLEDMRGVMKVNRYSMVLDDIMVKDLMRLADFLESQKKIRVKLHPQEWIDSAPLKDVRPEWVRLSPRS